MDPFTKSFRSQDVFSERDKFLELENSVGITQFIRTLKEISHTGASGQGSRVCWAPT